MTVVEVTGFGEGARVGGDMGLVVGGGEDSGEVMLCGRVVPGTGESKIRYTPVTS